MSRYQLLMGRHVQDEERVTKGPDGTELRKVIQAHYVAHDPKYSIVHSERAVIAARDSAGKIVSYVPGDMDLAAKFNKPNAEKFRKLPDIEQEMAALPDDAFRAEALRRGYKIEAPVVEPTTEATETTTLSSGTKIVDPVKPKQPPHPILRSIDKTPLAGLLKCAEDEEIDIAHCKNANGEWQEALVRKSVKTALEARSK